MRKPKRLYVLMSGMRGCIPEYAAVYTSKRHAIRALREWCEEAGGEMGVRAFEGRPSDMYLEARNPGEAGMEYAEIAVIEGEDAGRYEEYP